jgi:hypothetical protein
VLRRPSEPAGITVHLDTSLDVPEPRGEELLGTLVRTAIVQPNLRHGPPEWLIAIGGGIFILVLAVSAFWEPGIRWLHFFQAWMYIAAIVLSFRSNRWGYFIGISAAGLWDYSTIFANTFFLNGLQQLSQWTRTGHLQRPDLLIAVPAWFSNLMVIVGCVWAYFLMPKKSVSDAGRFLMAFALTTGFFALDMALFQPRYLAIFSRMLHPVPPW